MSTTNFHYLKKTLLQLIIAVAVARVEWMDDSNIIYSEHVSLHFLRIEIIQINLV